jgi:uncharacterized protein YndB with AHSA1/START domain
MDNEDLAEFSDRQTLRYVRFYPVPVERVWQAVTTSEYLNVWLYPVSRVEPRLGGRCSFTWGAPDDPAVAGKVTRFEPPRCVRYGTPAGYLQFDLRTVAGGTRFTFTQHFDPDFRHPDGAFPPDDKGAALPAGPGTPWRPGFVAGFHLDFRHFATFLAQNWPLERVRAESERRVALANSRGQDALQHDTPGGDWEKLVDVYTHHIRATCPAE